MPRTAARWVRSAAAHSMREVSESPARRPWVGTSTCSCHPAGAEREQRQAAGRHQQVLHRLAQSHAEPPLGDQPVGHGFPTARS
jgi:hypothetical protein